MFHLTPWKKRSENSRIRHDKPTRDVDCGHYPLARLGEGLDSLMARFLEDRWFGDRFFGNFPSLWDDARFDWDWDTGWENKEKEYVFRVELPGFEADDFDVKVSGNVLAVSANQKDQKKTRRGGSSHRYGSFTRVFTLPHGVDENNIDVRYHSGVLEVHLPKAEPACRRRIEVNSA